MKISQVQTDCKRMERLSAPLLRLILLHWFGDIIMFQGLGETSWYKMALCQCYVMLMLILIH